MQTMKALACLGLVVIASPAAANDWEKFYHPLPQGSVPFDPSDAPPQIEPISGDPESAIDRMWEQGYVCVGYSSFNSRNSSTKDAIKLANKLHAGYVLLGTDLTSSTTASIPITTPQTTTSMTTGGVQLTNNYGGQASGTFNGTTTTYGSQTSYIPLRINRFDKAAAYFVRLKRVGTGLLGRELTPAERTRYGTNHGIYIRAIRNGSPGYDADILPGDVVVRLNGQPAGVAEWRGWLDQLAHSKSAAATLSVVRGDKTIEIEMRIPPGWQGS